MIKTGENTKLTIKNNRIEYPRGRENVYEDLNGSLQYSAFYNEMIRLGNKAGIEYGIVGNKKKRYDYNDRTGYIGYKIDAGKVYITRFTPTSKATASKYVRDDMKSLEDRWILLGEIA